VSSAGLTLRTTMVVGFAAAAGRGSGATGSTATGGGGSAAGSGRRWHPHSSAAARTSPNRTGKGWRLISPPPRRFGSRPLTRRGSAPAVPAPDAQCELAGRDPGEDDGAPDRRPQDVVAHPLLSPLSVGAGLGDAVGEPAEAGTDLGDGRQHAGQEL